MKYILICLVLCSCSNSNTDSKPKSAKDQCFESGGSEYHEAEHNSGPGSYCVYRNNSCRLDK